MTDPRKIPPLRPDAMLLMLGGAKVREAFVGPDPYMVGTIALSVVTAGADPVHATIEVKHPCGSQGEPPLEVGNLVGYDGPVEWVALSHAVSHYYRGIVGRNGSLAHVGHGTLAIRNSYFGAPHNAVIPLPGAEQKDPKFWSFGKSGAR